MSQGGGVPFLAVVQRIVIATALVFGMTVACGGSGNGTERPTARLGRTQVVAAERDGNVVVLDRDGRLVRRVTTIGAPRVVTHLALTADRRTLLVGVRLPDEASSNCSAEVLTIPAEGGRVRRLAMSVASPTPLTGGRVAVAVLERRNDICLRVAIDVIDSSGERQQRIELPEPVADGTPPEQIMTASLDGRLVVMVGNHGLEAIDMNTRRTARVPNGTRLFAPAFATNDRLLAQRECCVAGMELVEVDLEGDVTPITQIQAPLEAADAASTARDAVLVTALHQLHLLENGALSDSIATDVVAATA